MRLPAVSLTLTMLASPCVAAEPAAEVPLVPYVRQLRTVDVRIGDIERPFLFDTGGGATCIIPELAAEVGCEPFGRLSGFRLSGERLDFERCGTMTVHVGGVPLDVAVVLFDINALLEDLPPLGGLISVHTFGDQPITIDLPGNRLVLESDASLAERTASMFPLNARYAHQAGGASLDPFIEVRAETGNLWLELDSGNISRTLLAPHAMEQLGLASLEDQMLALDIVGLGPVPLEVRLKEDCIYDGVLSAELFEGHVLTFDAPNGRLWAAPADTSATRGDATPRP